MRNILLPFFTLAISLIAGQRARAGGEKCWPILICHAKSYIAVYRVHISQTGRKQCTWYILQSDEPTARAS